ncbi:tyrosine-type recombinase/integrase [Candidatus Neomarinimicrobiota bacterium]
MSCLYKRTDSPYYWWAARYKGRLFRISTLVKQKHLANKVQAKWDLNLALDDLGFLGLPTHSPSNVRDYCRHYLDFLSSRKSEKTVVTARGVLKRLQTYLESNKVNELDEINVNVLDGYIDWLDNSPKTKKNYLGVISLMLDQAIKEGVLESNPAKQVSLPQIVRNDLHRQLDPVDLEIIFRHAGSWLLYYSFLYHTGLRAGDVALLQFGNINRQKEAITSFVRKSRSIHQFPIAKILLDNLPDGRCSDAPLFPALYADNERKLNDNLTAPRKYMQALLQASGRPKATLHSFRVTFNNTLRDLGLSIEDRQILLAHASSETTKIYTHPNFELASGFVNKVPSYVNGVHVGNLT